VNLRLQLVATLYDKHRLKRKSKGDIAMNTTSFDARTMPPRPLLELEGEWLRLFTEMRHNPGKYRIDAGQLAAPFLSTPASNTYTAGRHGTVMLVGKATSGLNTLGSAAVADAYKPETVKQRTPAVFDEVTAGIERSQFLRFAQRLSEAVAEAAGISIRPFDNLIWTNLAKIGVRSGNPSGAYFNAQMELAVETLAAEITHYRPSLVVASMAWFGYGPLRRAIPEMWDDHPNHPTRRTNRPDWWSHPANNGRPAILWTMHPQGKPLKVLDAWLDEAQKLVKAQDRRDI